MFGWQLIISQMVIMRSTMKWLSRCYIRSRRIITRAVLDKFEDLFTKCRGTEGVCWLHGVSILNGKICIIMKFYEGSVGDKMARLKAGKLSLPDVLRYGIDLAQGVSELHSKGILVLNLKPCNFLLNEKDRAVLGDIGIPSLLLGIPLPSSDLTRRLGSPNYMAPEQWQPDETGPISFETDSWGFGCSIVEMLTGLQPWFGMSVDEINNSVVRKQGKPWIPSGLPPPVENVLLGCFEYDFRSRPLMTDILQAFKSAQNADYSEAGWREIGSRVGKTGSLGYTEWFLSKDQLQVGDTVRSRKPLKSCKLENMDVPEGVIVGLDRDTDRDGFVLVRVHSIHDPLRIHISKLERVTHGLAAGDWVQLKVEDKKHSSVGILHSIDRDGSVTVGFIGMETLWKGSSLDLQMAESYCVGQFFPGLLTFGDELSSFMADPAEVEMVTFDTCPGIVKKYQHLEDFHWSVRPLVIAIGLFTAMKLGTFVSKKVGRSTVEKPHGKENHGDRQQVDGHAASNPAWLPPPWPTCFSEKASVPVLSSRAPAL
ncbi:hypothetical protein NL676_034086 [Syzygium grande]|nr:hypothetical protein NL676_034086 [Syzygium grande]